MLHGPWYIPVIGLVLNADMDSVSQEKYIHYNRTVNSIQVVVIECIFKNVFKNSLFGRIKFVSICLKSCQHYIFSCY